MFANSKILTLLWLYTLNSTILKFLIISLLTNMVSNLETLLTSLSFTYSTQK